MRKLILYIAASLDGYIARVDGSIDWLRAWPNPDNLGYGYNAFIESVDTILMGSNTYRDALAFEGGFPYRDKNNFVFTRNTKLATIKDEHAGFVCGDITGFVRNLKLQEGKHIWLIGGGELNSCFLNAGMIDELIITYIPIVLGGGIGMFAGKTLEVPMHFIKAEYFNNGLVQLYYEKQV